MNRKSNPNGAEINPLYQGGDQIISMGGILGKLQSSNGMENR